MAGGMEKHLRLRNLIWCRFYVFVCVWSLGPEDQEEKGQKNISIVFLSFFLSSAL
jgi:hypothetical protein